MSLDSADLENGVQQLFRERLNLDVPSVETDLIEGGLIDSLSLVELLLQLEVEFGVKVSLDDLEFENFRTIRNIARYLGSRRKPS